MIEPTKNDVKCKRRPKRKNKPKSRDLGETVSNSCENELCDEFENNIIIKGDESEKSALQDAESKENVRKPKKKQKNKKQKNDTSSELETSIVSETIEIEEPQYQEKYCPNTCTANDRADDRAEIEYKEYESELQMPDIMQLIQKDLSEPYSIYTYRYFIHNWPKLCFIATHNAKCVGAIVCKLDMHKFLNRGYIAMLAVDKDYRKIKIGTTLVQKAIEAMIQNNADEVVLETEITNFPALRLYENLGFVRDKRLFHYYLNGVDALRLKLWFR